MRVTVMLAMVCLLLGACGDDPDDSASLRRLMREQSATLETLRQANQSLVELVRTRSGPAGAPLVETLALESHGATIIFALWPEGDYRIWGIDPEGDLHDLACEVGKPNNLSWNKLPEAGRSWIRK